MPPEGRPAPLRQRRVARITVIDRQDQILLLHELPRAGRPGWWYTPGGEIEPGESAISAARRELLEETGLEPARLAGPILLRSVRFLFDGRWIDQHETHFAAWTDRPVAMAGRDGDPEADAVAAHRWWSVPEMLSTGETIFPSGLGLLVAALLRDGMPAEPWVVSEGD